MNYELKDRGSILDLSLLHKVQTGSEAYPASYQMGDCGDFPGAKAACALISPLTSI
jgi:hypothetical protein